LPAGKTAPAFLAGTIFTVRRPQVMRYQHGSMLPACAVKGRIASQNKSRASAGFLIALLSPSGHRIVKPVTNGEFILPLGQGDCSYLRDDPREAWAWRREPSRRHAAS
jgi:hypothetical protein